MVAVDPCGYNAAKVAEAMGTPSLVVAAGEDGPEVGRRVCGERRAWRWARPASAVSCIRSPSHKRQPQASLADVVTLMDGFGAKKALAHMIR